MDDSEFKVKDYTVPQSSSPTEEQYFKTQRQRQAWGNKSSALQNWLKESELTRSPWSRLGKMWTGMIPQYHRSDHSSLMHRAAWLQTPGGNARQWGWRAMQTDIWFTKYHYAISDSTALSKWPCVSTNGLEATEQCRTPIESYCDSLKRD